MYNKDAEMNVKEILKAYNTIEDQCTAWLKSVKSLLDGKEYVVLEKFLEGRQRAEDYTEEQYKKGVKFDVFSLFPDTPSHCLHDACPLCHGTGKKKDGSLCIHYISCPCPKCTPQC